MNKMLLPPFYLLVVRAISRKRTVLVARRVARVCIFYRTPCIFLKLKNRVNHAPKTGNNWNFQRPIRLRRKNRPSRRRWEASEIQQQARQLMGKCRSRHYRIEAKVNHRLCREAEWKPAIREPKLNRLQVKYWKMKRWEMLLWFETREETLMEIYTPFDHLLEYENEEVRLELRREKIRIFVSECNCCSYFFRGLRAL